MDPSEYAAPVFHGVENGGRGRLMSMFETSEGAKVRRALGPRGRWMHAMCYAQEDVYMFGGLVRVDNNMSASVHVFDAAERKWSGVNPPHIPVDPQVHEAPISPHIRARYIPIDSDMREPPSDLSINGALLSSSLPNDELWRFDIASQTWEFITKRGRVPDARFGHSLVGYKNRLFLFGGQTDDQELRSDLWSFDLTKASWKRIFKDNTVMLPRQGQAMVVLKDTLYLFGGANVGEVLFDTLHQVDLKSKKVSIVKASGPKPCARWMNTLNRVSDASFVLFGGLNQRGQPLNDVWVFDVAKSAWAEIKATNAPIARSQHASAVVDKKLYIWSGVNHDILLHDFWTLDLNMDTPHKDTSSTASSTMTPAWNPEMVYRHIPRASQGSQMVLIPPPLMKDPKVQVRSQDVDPLPSSAASFRQGITFRPGVKDTFRKQPYFTSYLVLFGGQEEPVSVHAPHLDRTRQPALHSTPKE